VVPDYLVIVRNRRDLDIFIGNLAERNSVMDYTVIDVRECTEDDYYIDYTGAIMAIISITFANERAYDRVTDWVLERSGAMVGEPGPYIYVYDTDGNLLRSHL